MLEKKNKIISNYHQPGHSFYDQDLEVQHAFEKARIAIQKSNFGEGSKLAQISLEYCSKAGWANGIGRSLMFLANCAKHATDYDEAFRYFESAHQVFRENNMLREISILKNNLANLYKLKLDFVNAIRLYNEAIEESSKLADHKSTVMFQLNLAETYLNSGNINLALQSVQIASEWIEKYDLHDKRRNVLYTLAQISYHKHHYEKALLYAEQFRKELVIYPNKEKSCDYHILYSSISFYLTETYHDGLKHAQEGIKLAQEINSPWHEGQAIQNAASLYYRLAQTEKAVDYYHKCSAIFRKIEAWEQLSIAIGNLAKMYLEQRNFEAIALLEESLLIAEKARTGNQIAEAHYNLYLAFKDEGQFALALKHYELYYEIEHKRIDYETENQIAVLYATQEKELLKLKAQELEVKLISQATQLVHQTELLSKFRDELRQVVRQSSSKDPTIWAIKEKLKELKCETVDWSKFEKEFTAVHPEFRAKLTEKYSELTKQEIKMCQLARLGLKTYEMSRLLCLSERTIDGHRNNLRKKLGLKPNENLKDFLQGIR